MECCLKQEEVCGKQITMEGEKGAKGLDQGEELVFSVQVTKTKHG